MSQKKILSFDVGIKNLAYCILDSNCEISEWKVLDIIEKNENNEEIVNCSCKNNNGTNCKSKAIYKKNDSETYYCNKHSSVNKEIIPDLSLIKKKVKVKSIPLNKMSILLFECLNKYPNLLNVNIVIIENQPCLMNPMIKTIQVLIYSYFTIKGILNESSSITEVNMVNARNKLSFYNGPAIETFSKNKYTQRKKESIEVCKYFIKDDTINSPYFLAHKKKDDLADAYLQGMWYIKKK